MYAARNLKLELSLWLGGGGGGGGGDNELIISVVKIVLCR